MWTEKSDNAGFEGLARGRGENALIVAQEKKPLRFLETDHSHDSLSVSDSLTHRLSPAVVPEGYLRPALRQEKQAAVCAFHESALVMVSDLEGGWR